MGPGMGANDKHLIRYSRGTGLNFGKAKNKASSLAEFIKLFSKPTRTKERFKTYLSLSNDEQVELKSVDGWVYRTQIEGGKRTAKSGKPSDVFSLDLDYATPDMPDRIEMGLVMPDFEFFVHSTRRHTEDKPRLRIWGVFSRPVLNDEYGPLSRIIAKMFDPEMKQVDKVSFRKAQMMFLPTASVDGDWFFHRSEGELFDPDAIFEEFAATVGDWRDITNLPRVEGEEVREHADKAEDPTTKKGPVGDFCRAYDVIEAIDKFELPYEAVDDNSEKPRYTYTGGTTTSGAVIEDGGLFLYSHHGSDPCADMLVNAFDLVRIHKFGGLDEEMSRDTPINQWPSYKAMVEFIQDDPGYKRQQAQSKYDMHAMFDDVMDEYFAEHEDEEDLVGDPGTRDSDYDDDIEELVGRPKRKSDSGAASAAGSATPGNRKKRKPPEGWFPDQLELDKGGNIVQNLPNAQVIIHNDIRLFDAIAYDDFMKRVVLRRDILSKMETVPPAHCREKSRGDIWQDFHDMTVRAILAAPNGKGKKGYGIDKLAERDLATAVYLTAMRNKFHPIKDYLESVRHDGRSRVDTFFIDYLGVADTPYAREAARAVLVASVCRIFEPGHKFDYAPVLQGPQGIRKSTLIEVLYGIEYFGELTCNLRDTQKIAETIGGIWGLEFPELAAFYKSDHNDAKQFLSAKEDRVRMAYDRRVSVFPRQATFWGTTNDHKYLKDPTGNRRWWPMIICVEEIDTDRLAANRDQIWAEAMAIYREMRAAQPTGKLPLYLRSPEAQAEATHLQTEARTRLLFEDWADQIAEWLDTPVSLQQIHNEYGMGERMPDAAAEKTQVLRMVFRVKDAARYALGIDDTIKNDQMTQNLDRAVSSLPTWINESALTGNKGIVRRLGTRGRWKVRKDATVEEIMVGYRILPEDDDLV
jgi:putative DNA primase/helicase